MVSPERVSLIACLALLTLITAIMISPYLKEDNQDSSMVPQQKD